MKLDILKCHGSENDFILIDETSMSHELSDNTRQVLAKTLCCRQSGIGADGILYYQYSSVADCRMRMFNPDGSEAEMCGNGLRCIGRYSVEKVGEGVISVETMKAILIAKHGVPIFDGIETYEVEIGPISLSSESLPMINSGNQFIKGIIQELSSSFEFTAISVPNPHIVTIVDNIDERIVEACGKKSNNSKLFPKGVNVSFVQKLDKNSLFVMTYERGVGITNACGTAMSASAFVSALNHLVSYKDPIKVFNKGGMVTCLVPDPEAKSLKSIFLSGNATFEFESTIEVDDINFDLIQRHDGKLRLKEIEIYANFKEYAETIVGGTH